MRHPQILKTLMICPYRIVDGEDKEILKWYLLFVLMIVERGEEKERLYKVHYEITGLNGQKRILNHLKYIIIEVLEDIINGANS